MELLCADVKEEINLALTTDTSNQGLKHLFALEVFRVDIYALLALHYIDYLELAKHMSQVAFELFGLPVTKLFVSIFVIKRHGLISFHYLSAISLLLVALHDTDDSFVPRDI